MQLEIIYQQNIGNESEENQEPNCNNLQYDQSWSKELARCASLTGSSSSDKRNAFEMVYKTWSSIKVRRSSHWPTCSLLIGCCAALKVVLFRDCCSEVLKLFSRPMGATPHLKLIHRNGRHFWARVTQLLSYSNYAHRQPQSKISSFI